MNVTDLSKAISIDASIIIRDAEDSSKTIPIEASIIVKSWRVENSPTGNDVVIDIRGVK